MTKLQKLGIYASGISVGLFGFASRAFMQVDPDLTAPVASTTQYMKDNTLAFVTDNITVVIAVPVLIIGIFLLWRIGRRFLGR